MEISKMSENAYSRISSGSQINKAADNAAGLSITQKMESQIKGSQQGVKNTESMKDLVTTADSSLGKINENIAKIRELALAASSGIVTEGDKIIFQNQINQLKQGITDVAKNTEFNTIKLLDGNFANRNTAMNPDGSGKQITIGSATLDNLGIKNFDVTGNFDISSLDNAMAKVSASRSNIGSVSNAFESAIQSSKNNAMNLSQSKSNIGDADIAIEISNLKRTQILQRYEMNVQSQKSDMLQSSLGALADYKL